MRGRLGARIGRLGALVGLLTALVGCRGPAPSVAPEQPPTVVLVGLDGFRADYLDRPGAVTLRRLADEGVRAVRMVPSFPTKTYPNFYTLATGLYPEHHGLVANIMYDPTFKAWFRLSDRSAVEDPRWWGGEPIWNTAVKQGRKAMVFFWPGSEAPVQGMHPTEYRIYDEKVPTAVRVRQVLDWVSRTGADRPALVAMYLSDTDHAGHRAGPDSPAVDSAIARMDSAVARLVAGFDARGLTDKINLVIVADHGMAALDSRRQIFLDDYLPLSAARIMDLAPVTGLAPRDESLDQIVARLRGKPHFSVYPRGETPARWHYRDSPRIPPIIVVADDGWQLTTHALSRRTPLPGGNHGYAPDWPSMGAVFVAWGPAFKRGLVVPSFQNIHVYPLLAHLMQIEPAPTDGRLDSVRVMLR
jgi:predicted AlkP superfamily pyrophosphatase or phosphodiesterase